VSKPSYIRRIVTTRAKRAAVRAATDQHELLREANMRLHLTRLALSRAIMANRRQPLSDADVVLEQLVKGIAFINEANDLLCRIHDQMLDRPGLTRAAPAKSTTEGVHDE
jgi:hypothetical protein